VYFSNIRMNNKPTDDQQSQGIISVKTESPAGETQKMPIQSKRSPSRWLIQKGAEGHEVHML